MRLKQALSLFRILWKGSGFRAFLFLIAVTSASSGTLGASTSVGSTILCRSTDKSVRTLRSDKTPEGGCRAVYTKQGVDQVVGSSTRENGCTSILITIRKTLESSSWKCKETKSGVVSNLTQ
jgi:hypothetical protein